MASIAIMVDGAVLNAATFIGGNYLARALGGDSSQAALDEKKRHDKALEGYQVAYNKYSRERTQLLDWIETNAEIHAQAKQNFTNTDYAFKLYNQAHPDKTIAPLKEPMFSDFYQPSPQQKNGKLLFWGAVSFENLLPARIAMSATAFGCWLCPLDSDGGQATTPPSGDTEPYTCKKIAPTPKKPKRSGSRESASSSGYEPQKRTA